METEHIDSARESRVLIIMTGGRICMQRSSQCYIPAKEFLYTCLAPRIQFNDGSPSRQVTAVMGGGPLPTLGLPSLRTPLSAYSKHVRYAILGCGEFLNSSSIDVKGWIKIACTIFDNYKWFDGFVVLHGTDSLAYTSSALSFMLRNLGKPVILTGSQVLMMELQNDATDNLLGSLIIAGLFPIPEVCLFFNYKLFRGNRVTKKSSTNCDAFLSPNFPPLASTSSLKTLVAWEKVNRAINIEPFSIHIKPAINHVACLRIFPGIQPEMIDVVLKTPGLKGLVLETVGAGNATGGPDGKLTRILADAVHKGILVVNVTQSRVLSRLGVIHGYDMTSEAALAKLSYLLGLPNVPADEVTSHMSMPMPLRGEFSAHNEFQHLPALISQRLPGFTTLTNAVDFKTPTNAVDFKTPTNVIDFTTLGNAVSSGNLPGLMEALKSDARDLLHESDYDGNTPLHMAGKVHHIEILRILLLVGVPVHLRNKVGRTPMFVAACARLTDHVLLLRHAGAHLHPHEIAIARSLTHTNPSSWRAAGM